MDVDNQLDTDDSFFFEDDYNSQIYESVVNTINIFINFYFKCCLFINLVSIFAIIIMMSRNKCNNYDLTSFNQTKDCNIERINNLTSQLNSALLGCQACFTDHEFNNSIINYLYFYLAYLIISCTFNLRMLFLYEENKDDIFSCFMVIFNIIIYIIGNIYYYNRPGESMISNLLLFLLIPHHITYFIIGITLSLSVCGIVYMVFDNFYYINRVATNVDNTKIILFDETYFLQNSTEACEQKACSICLEPYKDKDSLRLLNCKHCYHKECIDIWFNKKKTCPLCRSII